MSLTGLPLITLAFLSTVAVVVGTVLLWSRYGRWRLLSRAAGILLAETLVVFSIGLVVNRVDAFYPSWQALAGRTGTAVVTARQRVGRLDGDVPGVGPVSLVWHPSGAAGWRLAGSPTLVTPRGYRTRPAVGYPAVVDLVDPGPDRTAAVRAAKRVAVLSVVVTPTAATTAAGLAALPADLATDLRASCCDWAIAATPRQAALAEKMIAAAPGRYGSLVVVGGGSGPVVLREQAGIALAVVRTGLPVPVRHRFPGDRLTGGVTWLTAPASALWSAADGWAAGETSPPLAAARQLPTSVGTGPA